MGGGVLAAAVPPVAPEPVARLLAWSSGGSYLGRDGVRLQRGDWDCGVAVLAMLLEHEHHAPRLEGVRRRVLERGRGLSLLEMQAVAGRHGVRAAGWRLDFAGLASAPLPAVAHFRDHYVLVDHVAPDGTVRFRDPALGRVEMPRASFEKLWTGRALLLGRAP